MLQQAAGTPRDERRKNHKWQLLGERWVIHQTQMVEIKPFLHLLSKEKRGTSSRFIYLTPFV
jgi:hypothetical protein